MLENWNAIPIPEEEVIKERLKEAKLKLFALQLKMKEKGLPVIVLLEGWGSSGKGTVLGGLISNLDPRFFTAVSMHEPSKEEKRYPFIQRYFEKIPEKGRFEFFDQGWMSEITHGVMNGSLDKETYKKRIGSVNRFERSLTDNGYLVLKFFLHIDKKEQKRRLNALLSKKTTAWQVGGYDQWENQHYDKCYKIFDEYLDVTNNSTTPWYIINAKNKKWAELCIMDAMINGIEVALKNNALTIPLVQNTFPLKSMPKLSEIDLKKTITDEEYKKRLKELQKKLRKLHNQAYLKKIPIIVAYEGWDAGGKGGNIKRLTAALDPRGYEVIPVASPKPFEKARHHLWRFFINLPKTGHFAIFDRTWYGRVMVERLEGFCSENDWQRAYNEINEFEKELYDWGAIIIKFWVHIDKDTQLARFTDRQNNPDKQWKITDEDWRNREKWDLYEEAVDEMIQKTSTTYAPWVILESVDKHYARIKALETVIEALEERLKD